MDEQDGVPPPAEGDDAGPAEEYWASWHLERIQSAHERASDSFNEARDTLDTSPEDAEGLARQALAEAAQAYWFAEGSAGARAEHKYLHRIGRWARRTFGCEFDWDGVNYRTSCPVKLADKRFGLSVGFVGRKVCSICDQSYSACHHNRDRLYWVYGGPTTFGPCRVCHKDLCDHSPGELHKAPVVGIWRDMVLKEASFVDVPANPLARPVNLEVATDETSRAVRAAFPDVPAHCNHCLEPYHGLPEPLNISGLSDEWLSSA